MNLQDLILQNIDNILSTINHVIEIKSIEILRVHPEFFEHPEDVEYQITGNYFEPEGQTHILFLDGERVAGFTVWAEYNGFELLVKSEDIEI